MVEHRNQSQPNPVYEHMAHPVDINQLYLHLNYNKRLWLLISIKLVVFLG